jgi:hypothetical protein
MEFNLIIYSIMFKSDPYIQIQCGKNKIDSRDKYIPNTVNPEFGRYLS